MRYFRANAAILFGLIFITVQIIPGCLGEDDTETDTEVVEPERTCKKYISNLVQGFLTAALNCLGGKFQMNKITDLGTRFYCLFKCVLQDVGVLGADGRLDEVQALFYFQESIPEIILDVVISDAQPCLEMASAFEPSQYYCQSYGPFVQCVLSSLVRTLAPYALNCYATPNLTFFFGFINSIVPQPTTSAATAREIKKRYTDAKLRYSRSKNQRRNATLLASKTVSSTPAPPKEQFLINSTIPPFKPIP